MISLQAKEHFDFRLVETQIKEPGVNEVLVEVLACGVCGSDVHLMKRAKEYSPLGHEIAAKVVKTGPGAERFSEGDTVIVEDVTLCGYCTNCKQGDTHLCRNNFDLDGQSGMGEYLTVHANALVPYEGLDPVAASLTEPLAVSLNTLFAADVPPSGTLVIYGIGVLGLMCAKLAKHYGASKVVCVGSKKGSERNMIREDVAYKMGADKVLYSDDDIEKEVVGVFGKKADAVIVTSPPSSVPDAIKTAGFGAKVVVIGLDLGSNAEAEVDIDQLIINKNSIIPVFAEPAKLFPLSIELLKSAVIEPELLVTHTVKLNGTDAIKELFLEDRPVIKAVVTTKE